MSIQPNNQNGPAHGGRSKAAGSVMPGDVAEELEVVRLAGCLQNPDRPARYPACAVEQEATAQHDAMQVGMVGEGLTPSIQYRDEADLLQLEVDEAELARRRAACSPSSRRLPTPPMRAR